MFEPYVGSVEKDCRSAESLPREAFHFPSEVFLSQAVWCRLCTLPFSLPAIC